MKGDNPLPSWICTALMRIGMRMATEFDHQFSQLGITQAQFRILLAIAEQGGSEGLAPSVLADYLLIERGTVSVLTSRMVERGWLMRRPGANRRTFRLVLSEEGTRLLEEAIPRATALANSTLAQIPHENLSQLRENLELLEKTLRASGPPER